MLALEAAAEACSVTLHTPNVSESLVISEARSHAKQFLPLVEKLMSKHGVSMSELDFIACGNGPGSFTGLRICFGVAQGLAFGLGIPMLTVSSLESMAHEYWLRQMGSATSLIAMLDARMGEIYLGEFVKRNEEFSLSGQLQLLSVEDGRQYVIDALIKAPQSYALIGSAAPLLRLSDELLDGVTILPEIQPLSSSVMELALFQWRAGKRPQAADAEICYLRNSVSWEKRKRIRANP